MRHHWLVSILLVAGLVLRVLAQIGYRPALLYVDSLKYLYGASPGSDPLGYRVVLKVILLFGDLGTVAAIQHLLGLAMAVALYLVLLRRGVPVWLSAVAVAPVLLDGYQLQMEQTIMPDVWFEALIVAGLAVLLWRPVLTPRFAIAAGLILGASATVKALGEFLVLPVLVYLLAARRPAPDGARLGRPDRRVRAADPRVLRYQLRQDGAFLAGPAADPDRAAGRGGRLFDAEAARAGPPAVPDAGPAAGAGA